MKTIGVILDLLKKPILDMIYFQKKQILKAIKTDEKLHRK